MFESIQSLVLEITRHQFSKKHVIPFRIYTSTWSEKLIGKCSLLNKQTKTINNKQTKKTTTLQQPKTTTTTKEYKLYFRTHTPSLSEAKVWLPGVSMQRLRHYQLGVWRYPQLKKEVVITINTIRKTRVYKIQTDTKLLFTTCLKAFQWRISSQLVCNNVAVAFGDFSFEVLSAPLVDFYSFNDDDDDDDDD